MKNATIIAMCLGIFLCGAPQSVRAQIAAPDLNLSFANWSTKQAKALNAEPKDAVSKFVSNLLGLRLCSFQFVDLRHSGQLSLVLSDDGGGTADCNYLQILDKMPSGIENYDFQTVAGDTYLDGVKDLNGDGHYEVIVDVYFGSGGSIDHCGATWPVIYAWTSDGYGDVSRDFKHYYEQQLAVLQKRNAAAEAEKERARQAAAAPAAPVWNCQAASVEESAAPAAPGTKTGVGVSPDGVGIAHFCWPAPPPPTLEEDREEDRRGLDCDKAEAAKLERFLGISRDAGMSDAIKWANSDNPDDREFAADIFADIGTGQAQEYLKTLSHDPDRSVAMSVKGWVSGAKPPATYPTLKGELIPITPGYPPAK